MESIPSVLSFLICDMIIVEAGTGKKTLVGVFDAVNAPKLPILVRLGVYARLTDMQGAYAFKIRVVHLGEAEELVGMVETPEHPVNERLQLVDLALNLPPVMLKKAGRYEFQLSANDVYVGRAVLTVVMKAEGDS